MLTEPLRIPAAEGLKTTAMVQEAPAAMLAGQLLAWPKSPLETMPPMVTATAPTLVRTATFGGLAALTS